MNESKAMPTPHLTDDLAQTVDRAVLDAMTKERPNLVRTLRELVQHKQTNQQILRRCCNAGATPTLMRNLAHCLDAIRRGQ